MSVRSAPFAFSGTVEPTRVSLAYRFGLVIVGVAMLLLPLLYLGFIALTGAAVWWHVTANAWMLTGKGNGQVRLFLYVAPAVVGTVLAFFMVKPILARPSRGTEPVAIDPDAEPTLFAFIEAICRQVRAPIPRRVQIDCQVNASAGFLRRPFALFTNDLVLTIGLPLAAGLSVRELGGVLAHEFGHFAQGGGMRLTGVVRGVNAWFARVVYERDAWDEKLERWSRDADWRLSIILVIARGAVWVSRQILTGLMMTGFAISCFMLRQMEFDADSYEIKIAGSETFVRTSARMREISAGVQFGYGDLREGLRKRTLPAQLPVFVVQRCDRLPDQLLNHIRTSRSERTGVFDTHPSDGDRARAAERAGAPGVLVGGDRPATALFTDFEGLSTAATRHYYEHELGLSLDSITLIDTSDAIRESTSRDEHRRAFQLFFGESVSMFRPLSIPISPLAPLGESQLRPLWSAARDTMVAGMMPHAEPYRQFDALETKRDKAVAAQELLAAGFSEVTAADFDLPEGTAEAARSADLAYQEQQRRMIPALQAYEAAVARRLACAVRLRPDCPGAEEAESLIEVGNALARALPVVHEVRRLELTLETLHQNESSSARVAVMQKRIAGLDAQLELRLVQIRTDLAGIRCPEALGTGAMSLADRCGLRGDGTADPAAEIVDRMLGLYAEILGRLAALALESETRLEAQRAEAAGVTVG